jgi:hypothetical protein
VPLFFVLFARRNRMGEGPDETPETKEQQQ